MHVSVAVVPPEHVLDDVEAALARTPVPAGELDRVPRGSLMIPVFSLGNVARPEATRVADLLRATLDSSPPPARVRFAGVWALEAQGDPSIALPLVGEADRLHDLARTLSTLVAQHGWYVDRRRWAPRMTVASVTATTSLPVLEHLVADLEGHEGPPWPVASVALVRPRLGADDPGRWEVLDEVPTATVPD